MFVPHVAGACAELSGESAATALAEWCVDMRGAALAIDGLSCRFGGLVAVDDVGLRVEAGEHVALVGTNGSGKSTLLRAVLGLQGRSRGRIVLDGTDARSPGEWDARRRLAPWIPQRQATGRFPLTVEELLDSSGHRAAAVGVATRLGVAALARQPLHTLSGGQLQRCFIARAFGAMANGGRLLLADEPTAALDFDGRDAVAGLLRALPASVLVATHDRAVAARCDRVLEMANGRVREVRM